jgi:hypothetical protein
MDGSQGNIFNTLYQLQKQLADNQLTVIHSGISWVTSFEWFPPVSHEEIQKVETQLSCSLPQDYKKFLTDVSNGAILFYDKEYGQWGYKLFNVMEILEKQYEWEKNLPRTWKSGLIAFGELFGEANVLVFDLRRPTNDSLSCMVLEGNAYDELSNWAILSRSFHEWLDHLITAQGDKYWLWV